MQKLVFVSFSNKDAMFAEEILAELKEVFGSQMIDVWTEKRLEADDDWGRAMQEALASSSAAIVLISSEYLSSLFIKQYTMQRLLKQAEEHGVLVKLISVSESSFDLFGLAEFNFLNEPSKELIKLGAENRKLLWSSLIHELREKHTGTHDDILHAADNEEIDGLFAAIRSRFPGKSEEEINAIYAMLTEAAAKHIGAGDQMASVRKISDSEIDVNPFDIDGLDP